MKIRNLDVGVEAITRWQVQDEIHLPEERALSPTFLPAAGALDAILRRPSLDERLASLMQPEFLDPELLEPFAMAEAREGARASFSRAANAATGRRRKLFEMAGAILDSDIELDDEVRGALAALLKG